MFGTTRCWRRCGFQLALASSVLVGGAIAIFGDCVLAQITPDVTLPNNSIVTPQSNTSVIEGGTQAGRNLFHSFDQFSIPTGGGAYFNNALDIQNIFSRVTGKSISNIDGLIRANGTANLFLLNPNGIIFGPNASLDIGGSFVGSTASAVNFADGTQFSATAPQTAPLLSVSVPIGLQFGGTAGSILNQSQVTNSIGEAVGLQVQPGKTLALVGGDVSVDGGIMHAPGGRVDLGGVAGAGTVGLNVDSNNLGLSFPIIGQLRDVSLTNGSSVNVSAGGGGSIALNARNLYVLAESRLQAGIASDLGSVGTQGGDITLNAKEAITIANDSVIANGVLDRAVGNGGGINITTESLAVIDGAQVVASTYGQGNAGNVNINARSTVEFDGVNSNSRSSGAFSLVGYTGAGNGGEVNITAESLSMSDGAQLVTITQGQGNAGSVNINARDTVSFDGESSDGFLSGAFSRVEASAVGQGGDIRITTGSLAVTNGAQLNASTLGQGDAGSVTINARDTVSFNGYWSGAFSDVGDLGTMAGTGVESGAVGNSGSINITTGALSVTNFALLSATSEGNNAAGNIEVSASSILLDNYGELTATNEAGNGGNIALQVQDLLLLRRNSYISTSVSVTNADGNGGNITINTNLLAVLEDSGIVANVPKDRGGNIQINTQGFFLSPDSGITASGGSPSLSGTVEINTPDVDITQGLATLPAELVEASGLITSSCAAVGENKFTITGRGGLPPSPNEILSSDAVWVDWGTLNPKAENSSSPTISTNPTVPEPAPIVEARGWVINDKGEVMLTATAPNVTPHTPWISSATCHTPQVSS